MTLLPPMSDEQLQEIAAKRLGGRRDGGGEPPAPQLPAYSEKWKRDAAGNEYTEIQANARFNTTPKRKSSHTSRLLRGPAFAGVTITVPLRYCVSDNGRAKYTIARNRRQLILTPEYRQAKETIGAIARRAMGNVQPASAPVAWEATVYFENNRRDLMNHAKLLADALNGIVYADDKLIHSAHWTRGENDKVNPRIEITVEEAM